MKKNEIADVVKKIITEEETHEHDLFPEALIEHIADAALALGVTEKTAEFVACGLLDLVSDEMTDPDLWDYEEKDLKDGTYAHEKDMIVHVRPEIKPVHVIHHYDDDARVWTATKISSESQFAEYLVKEAVKSWAGWTVM